LKPDTRVSVTSIREEDAVEDIENSDIAPCYRKEYEMEGEERERII
jgi:hypothetical protein